ncbi:MAG: hypothetical protein MMC33_004878 [Icmadophila ericetorum]|nr:hypothetical protein [Icmadophila ericetorum]
MEGKTNVAKVTVIGLGVSGLGALKNLLEEGFDAVGLERSEYLVIVANGSFKQAYTPKIDGIDKFKGRVLHSQEYKGPKEYTKQHVTVVGLSNSGGDVATELSNNADKVYISHRSGVGIAQRQPGKARPTDHKLTRRVQGLGFWVANAAPEVSAKLAAWVLGRQMKKTTPNFHNEWGLLPVPPVTHSPPIMSDYMLDLLASNSVTSVPGIRRFVGENEIELRNGTTISGDAVIICTGYYFDFSLMSPDAGPTAFDQPEWATTPHSNGTRYSRLYRGLLSSKYPDSLAFIGAYRGHSFAAFANGDLISQAIAQLWKGAYSMPSKQETNTWCDSNYRYLLKQLALHRLPKVGDRPGKLEPWLNEVAGNGINEKLGWGWEGWKFWWNEQRLYRMLMDGIDTPYVYRLFDGRRKKWKGAREAVYQTNGKKINAEHQGGK